MPNASPRPSSDFASPFFLEKNLGFSRIPPSQSFMLNYFHLVHRVRSMTSLLSIEILASPQQER
ncbi:MAG: hypothetical protein ACTSUT_13790 [Promethearchaeota archaeon]